MAKEYYIEGRPVKAFYRDGSGKARPIFEDVGFHYGDLGKARDTNYFSMSSGRRSTGHFGTGTYFYGRKQDTDNMLFSRKDRPEHKVDFKDYKLYKVKDETEAYTLHEGLKALNYGEYDSPHFERLKDILKNKKKTNIEIYSALSKVEKEKKRLDALSWDKQMKEDSLSTTFMKELGYEGIDVRFIDNYDNSSYGSVIYDIKKK